jgi:signal transduction histidine kinase
MIRVEDDGIGFDMASQEAVQGGGGFGLPSVKERLELIGARFNLESAPGKGTRILITLPLAEQARMSG